MPDADVSPVSRSRNCHRAALPGRKPAPTALERHRHGDQAADQGRSRMLIGAAASRCEATQPSSTSLMALLDNHVFQTGPRSKKASRVLLLIAFVGALKPG